MANYKAVPAFNISVKRKPQPFIPVVGSPRPTTGQLWPRKGQ